MVKASRSRWLITVVMGLCALMVIGALVTPAYAQRQGRFVEQTVTSGSHFNEDRGHGEPIEWNHSLSTADVSAANSGGVIVDAYDVDYPAGTEFDRLRINGNDYGLLEGQNNQWGSTEKSINIGDLQSGSNAFRVDPDEDPAPPDYVLQIRRSTLFLYADEDFELDASPNSRSVDTFDETTYEVEIDWIGVWDNEVNLSVSGLPSGATAVFSPRSITSNGGTSTLTVTLENVTPGRYPLTITGRGRADYEDSGGSRSVTRTTEVNLVVGGVDGGFSLIRANPEEIEVELGQTVTSKILGDFIGTCQGPITIDIEGSRFVMDATGNRQFDRIDEPEMILARLMQTALTPGDNDATLEMHVGLEMAPGEYDVVVRGTGCGLRDQEATVTLVVKAANLVITKHQSQATVKPNMVQIYTLRVENKGAAPATGVTVTDTLTGDLTYVSDTATDAVHSENNGQHTWVFNKPLRPGHSFSFNLNVRVDPFVRAGRSISNLAEVTADQVPEPIVSNTVTAVSGFESVEPEGLQVTKRALKRDARIGGILIYRIEVENISPAGPIFDIVLKDRMPNGFKIPDGKTVRDGSVFTDSQRSGRTYTWQLGHLGPGQRTVITYQAVVGTNAASGRNENRATATGVDGGGNRVSGEDSALVMLGAGDLEWLGEINAQAYQDTNRNNVLDKADKPIKGVTIILVPPGLKQTTGEEGETIFTDLESGQYALTLDLRSLPKALTYDGDESHLIRLMEGENADFEFLFNFESGIKVKVKVEKKARKE